MMKKSDWKKNNLRSFAGRELLVEDYYYKVMNEAGMLLLRGEEGSGKTALLCKIIDKLEKENKKVFYFFPIIGCRRKGVEVIIQELLEYLEKQLGITHYWGTEKEKKSKYQVNLERLKEICNELQEKVYVCIDDIDWLAKKGNLQDILFLMDSKQIQIVAACTYVDYLPLRILKESADEKLPELDLRDSKKMLDTISETYSCNMSEQIKKEILKKNSIGNPRYISLLHKGLGLLKQEELKKQSEEEWEECAAAWIHGVPEETRSLAALVLEMMADKISSNSRGLKEAMNFLAVSRNGLRMRDLQKILASCKEAFSVTEFSDLMESMEDYFYIRKEEWIELSRGRIYWKLGGEETKKDSYNKKIKEHIICLDMEDVLVIKEGEYYSRITREDENLRYESIKLNCRTDIEIEGLKPEKIKEMAVYDYSCGHQIEEQAGIWAEYPYERVIQYIEALHEIQQDENSLRDLYIVYCNMARFCYKCKTEYDALKYYEKAKTCVMDSKWQKESRMYYLSLIYEHMGQMEQADKKIKLRMRSYDSKKVLSYYEKVIQCKEEFYGDNLCEDLYISYHRVGEIFRKEECPQEAVTYYKKALYCKEEQYKKEQSRENLQEVYLSYKQVGDVLLEVGKVGEALYYYEKVLRWKKEQEESNLQEMYISYNNIGHVLRKMGQPEEAVSYYKEALTYVEESCKMRLNKHNLWDLGISYSNIGAAYQDMGQLEEAVIYFEKAYEKMKKVM